MLVVYLIDNCSVQFQFDYESALVSWQVTLYSLIMADRRSAPDEGLLVYLKHNEMTAVPVKSSNTRGMFFFFAC